jgi:hypothetical protein
MKPDPDQLDRVPTQPKLYHIFELILPRVGIKMKSQAISLCRVSSESQVIQDEIYIFTE